MINFWKFRKIVIFSFLTIIFSLFLLFFQPNFSYEKEEKWEKNLTVRIARRSKRSNVENKAAVAWTTIKDKYFDDLKVLNIYGLTDGGLELVNIVRQTADTSFADLSVYAQNELKALVADKDWEAKIKVLIAAKKVVAAAWTKIKTDYLADLKALKIYGLTDESWELANIVTETADTNFADLSVTTQNELKALIEGADWETKIKALIADKKVVVAVWTTIKTDYLADLKALNIYELTDGGWELERIVRETADKNFADLSFYAQAELKALVANKNWETKIEALIAAKKVAAAVWTTIKTDYLADLKTLDIDEFTNGGRELVSIVTETANTSFADLSSFAQAELKALVADKDWEDKIKVLIAAKKVVAAVWTTIKTDYLANLKALNIYEFTNGGWELANIVRETADKSFVDLGFATQNELKALVADKNWEAKIQALITAKKVTAAAWTTIKTDYLADLKSLNIYELTNGKGELEFIVTETTDKSFADLSVYAQNELKALVADKNWIPKIQALIAAKKVVAAAWVKIKIDYLADLKALDIDELTNRGKELANIVTETADKSFADLGFATQNELKALIEDKNWEAKIQALIADKKTENAATAWTTIKNDYLADLKVLNIDELTNGGKELKIIVTETADKSFADLGNLAQTELEKLVADKNWEAKIKALIADKKSGSKVAAAWAKIKTDYLDDLKVLNLKGTTDGGKELEETVKKTASDSFADLGNLAQAELKALVADKDWEAKIQALIANKKAAAAWVKIKTDYLADLKVLNLKGTTNGGKELEETVKTVGTENFVDLDDPVQNELKALVQDKNWETKIKVLIADKKTEKVAAAAWTTIKTDYLDDIQTLNIEKVGEIDISNLAIIADKTTVYDDLSSWIKVELENLVAITNWETTLQELIKDKKAEVAWNFLKTKITILKANKITVIAKKKIDLILNQNKNVNYVSLDSAVKTQLKDLITVVDYQKKIDAVLPKEEKKEKDFPLTIVLGVTIPTVLLIAVVVGYFIFKKHQKNQN